MGVLLRTEDTQDIIVLMDRLAKVPPLLLVPPAFVGVSELALLTGRVRVVAILSSVNCRAALNRQAQYREWVFGLFLFSPKSAQLGEGGAGEGVTGSLGQAPRQDALGQHWVVRHDHITSGKNWTHC